MNTIKYSMVPTVGDKLGDGQGRGRRANPSHLQPTSVEAPLTRFQHGVSFVTGWIAKKGGFVVHDAWVIFQNCSLSFSDSQNVWS